MIERRIEAGLDPDVASVASLFISRWDVAVAEEVPEGLVNRLGIAVGGRAYRAYRELLDSARMQRLMNEGARPQRLLWASTGTKDPDASDTMYIEAFASPFTVNTMPEPTLLAFADHGEVGDLLPSRRRQRRGGAEGVRGGRDRRRGACRASAGRGQRELQQVLGRAAEVDRLPASAVDERAARDAPAWCAAAGPLRGAQGPAPPRPLRRRPRRAASAWSPRAPASTSTSRRTGSPTRR